MTTKVKWAKFTQDHTFTRLKTRRGTPMSQKAFKAGYEGPVTHAELDSAIGAGAAQEVTPPDGAGTDKSGAVTDRTKA